MKTKPGCTYEKLMAKLDGYAIGIGLFALIVNLSDLCAVLANIATVIAACVGACYIVYPLWLYISRRADFDWHLIHGKFLRKVCCIVLLAPFILTCIGGFFLDSPKELIHEENLYAIGDTCVCEYRESQESPNLFWGTYYHFIDAGNQHMTTTLPGRIWAAVVGLVGIFLLGGLMVSSIIGWIDRRKESWQKGTIRYSVKHLGKYRFAVVIGANEIASSVIRNLFTPKRLGEINYKCEGDNKYVLLYTCRSTEDVRAELSSRLTDDQMKRVVIYHGFRDSAAELNKLYVRYATEVYVLGETTLIDGGETYHDSMNMRCVNIIADQLEQSRTDRAAEKSLTGHSIRKVCKVMFEYQTTSSIFQFSDISDLIKQNLIFIPFNRYEAWARKVMVEGFYQNVEYCPLEGKGIPQESDEFVHFVIVGMSKMGVAMGLEAMLQAHYLNSARARTRITFIDSKVDKEMNFFKGRYSNMFELIRTRYIDATSDADSVDYGSDWCDPLCDDNGRWNHLSNDKGNFLDVEIEFIKGDIESDGVRKCLGEIANDANARLTMAVCLTQTHQAVAACLYLPMEVYRSERLQQVWVYQPEYEDIISNISTTGRADVRYEKIRPFGMVFGEYMSDRSLYLKAMLSNVAYACDRGDYIEGWPKDILDKGDKGYVKARIEWKQLSVDKKWSNKYFADSIYIKIRNLMLDDPQFGSYAKVKELLASDLDATVEKISSAIEKQTESLAVCEHNRWVMQQLLLGFSPCDAYLDKIFEDLERGPVDNVDVCDRYYKWKKDNLHISEKIDDYNKIKDDLKECSLRIHSNICSMDHLLKIDPGAVKYDLYMNKAIPKIISIVDRYRS